MCRQDIGISIICIWYAVRIKIEDNVAICMAITVVEGVIDSIDIVSLNGTGPISQMARKKSQKDIWCKCYVRDGA